MRSSCVESKSRAESNAVLRSELAEILAAGLLRFRARQARSEGSGTGESSLDFTADQSVHANVLPKNPEGH